MTAKETNPYATPHSDVRATSNEYAEAKMFSFSGRLGRVRYMAYSLGLILTIWLGGILMAIIIPLLASLNDVMAKVVSSILAIGLLSFFLAAGFTLAVRRIHDFDTSGWLSLLFLIPIVNFIFGLILWIIPGTDGANRFGLQSSPNGTGVKIAAVFLPVGLAAYIGIMAAVAIPAYQDYVERAKAAQMQNR